MLLHQTQQPARRFAVLQSNPIPIPVRISLKLTSDSEPDRKSAVDFSAVIDRALNGPEVLSSEGEDTLALHTSCKRRCCPLKSRAKPWSTTSGSGSELLESVSPDSILGEPSVTAFLAVSPSVVSRCDRVQCGRYKIGCDNKWGGS